MISFSEVQRFKQWWLWLIIAATLIVPVAITFYNGQKQPSGHLLNDILIGAIGPVFIILLFLIIRLKTRIDASGIYYRFIPVHFQVLVIDWESVEKAYVRQYSPLLDYGGWGIRIGLGGKGKAYNIAGNMGLQIELKTGKKILIGTQRPEEITQLLNQLVKDKVISRNTIAA